MVDRDSILVSAVLSVTEAGLAKKHRGTGDPNCPGQLQDKKRVNVRRRMSSYLTARFEQQRHTI